jgi:hypothetical protein
MDTPDEVAQILGGLLGVLMRAVQQGTSAVRIGRQP